MTKKFFSLLAFAACLLGLVAQTASDPNEGLVVSQDSTTGAMNLSWWGVPGRAYFIEYSSDLINWSYLPVAEAGTGEVIQYGVASTDASIFLRLNYSDGLTGDPYAFDSDGDGLPDWWEYYNFGHLGVTQAEAASLFDPVNGLNEWWEMKAFGRLGMTLAGSIGINDSANGINEFWELQNFGQLGVTLAQANAIDTDGDGIPDWWEITNYGHLGVGGQDLFVTTIEGTGQTGPPGYFLPVPWTVNVTDANGHWLANVPITFSLPAGDPGWLSATGSDADESQTVTVNTDSRGFAWVYWKL